MQCNLSVFFDRSVALFSLGTLVYSINKTDRHTINETLLKVVLKHTPNHINVLGNYISHNINLLHDIATKLLEQVEFSHLLMLHSAKYCSDPVQLIPPIPIVMELLV